MSTAHSAETPRAASLAGIFFVALSAFGFSAKAILVKLAYLHPVDAVTLLALRMAFALPFFLLMALWGPPAPAPVRRADVAAVAGLGLLGYYLASFLDFWGLEFISAGLERLILFLYPTFVLVFSWLFFGRPVKPAEALALVFSYAGIALVFYRQVSLGQPGLWQGAGLVFGSTLAYAAYLLGSHRAIARWGARRFTAYAMSAACLACLLQFALTHPWAALRLPAPVFALALAMAVFSTVLPALWLSMGIQRIGPGRAALVGSLGPVATIGLAYAVLGEAMGLDQLAGAALVLAGVLAVSLGKR
jgi:drug/metabolite transporter (DMT)-like permease